MTESQFDRAPGGNRNARPRGVVTHTTFPLKRTPPLPPLLRRASPRAGKLNTNWFAFYVRTPKESPQRVSAREHRLLSENVTLAMELGAKVVWLAAEDVAAELLRFAREHAITLAIFGKSRRPWWLSQRR